MSEEYPTSKSQTNTHLMTLVETALGQDKLSGISEILKSIAEAVGAMGSILWEVDPSSEVDKPSSSSYLFVLAQWFQDDSIRNILDLPLDHSVTGAAILCGEPINVDDVWNDDRVYKNDPHLRQAGIKALCSVPIDFPDRIRGAISLYRNTPIPFNKHEVAQAKQLASLVPSLYHAVRDKVSSKLIQQVNKILQEAELRILQTSFTKVDVKEVCQRICDLVAETFQCIETSIFFEDQFESPGTYQLIATTWPYPDSVKQPVYKRNEGITGWVLANLKPIKIFDLANLDLDRAVIQSEYPGLSWRDPEEYIATARQILALPDGKLQPLSFMAAPIVRGDEALGIIRCWIARQGPFYFAKHELNLLALVATQIGRYWNNWLIRR